MDVRRRLGRNVKVARLALGLSQEGLAFDCGLHRTYVSGVERGVRNPTVTVLDKLAAALNVPPGRLLDEPTADADVASIAATGAKRAPKRTSPQTVAKAKPVG